MAVFYKDVYNKDIKERFLKYIDLDKYPPRWWERVFEKSYMFEKIHNKDLHSFTVPEIIEFYKFLDIGTLTPLMVYNTNLIIYSQWALNEALTVDGQNHFDELNMDMLTICISPIKAQQSILSYDKFMDLIKKQIINEQDKFVFFCLFEGIKGKNYQEIVDLKMSDINEKDCSVQLSTGRNIYVSPEFIEIARQADRQTTYIGLTMSEMEIALVPSANIFKEKSNSGGKNINRTVYNTIVRNINTILQLGEVVTAKSIRDSGLIYHLNKRAENLGVSVEEIMYNYDNWRDLIEKYNFNFNAKKRWLAQYKDFLK